MSKRTKTVCWCAVAAVALMMCAGCVLVPGWAERQNEVTRGYARIEADGEYVVCVEQITPSTNNALKSHTLYVKSEPVVQTYRIENHMVFNCRWSDRLYDWDWKEGDVVTRKGFAMIQASRQLPNMFGQIENPFQPWESGSVVTMTEMGNSFGMPFSLPVFATQEFVTWGVFGVHQWAGTQSEVPAPIEQFRQAVEQALSAPEHVKKYKSYLRAVPLFTKEELEAEKDTPLIDSKKGSYHVQYAINHPYILIPLSGQKSPFFPQWKYKPGDKFKVRDTYKYNNERCYYLIETFKGEKK